MTNLTPFPVSKTLQKAILNLMNIAKCSPKGVENAVGKGGIAVYEQFQLFPQYFQKTRACLGKG